MSTNLLEPSTQKDTDGAPQKISNIGQNMRIGIGSFSSWMLGVGGIIGSMAWLFHSYMIARAGAFAAVSAWILAGLVFLPVTLILAELSSMFPAAGGPYLYKYYALKRLIPKQGELFGFLTGWLFWVCLIVGYACMSNGLANLVATSIWGTPTASPVWFGPVIIFSLFFTATAANQMHVSKVTGINNLFTIMKFAMALGFGALVLSMPTTSFANLLHTTGALGSGNFFANLASVMTLAIGGFGGIELVACASSETANAPTSVPKSMMRTLISVALIYAGMCAAVAIATPYVLSPDQTAALIPGTTLPATIPGVTAFLAGKGWGQFATALVIASIVGCALGGLLACARIGYSMAHTGLFPAQFGTLSGKTAVPSYSLWFQFGCLCVVGIGANILSRFGVFPDAYSFLGETFSFMYIMLVVLYGASLISLRYTDPHLPRPFRIGASGNGLAWLMSIATVVIFGYIAFGCTKWIYQLAGFLILAAGIPVYGYYRWRK
jgi:amino acid transporter